MIMMLMAIASMIFERNRGTYDNNNNYRMHTDKKKIAKKININTSRLYNEIPAVNGVCGTIN